MVTQNVEALAYTFRMRKDRERSELRDTLSIHLTIFSEAAIFPPRHNNDSVSVIV